MTQLQLLTTPTDAMLPWLERETLFSLASRHHRLWGFGSSWSTTELLFGGHRAGTYHDLPGALDEFAARTCGTFGSADKVARERTLLRFYRPFMASDDVAAVVSTMRGTSVAHLKFRLGLLTSRFRANHPLKACDSCMQDDLRDHGWVYWHLDHQYPGVWICPRHGDLLLESTLKSTGVERFLWHLPTAEALTRNWEPSSPAVRSDLASFTTLVVALVEHPAEDGWLAQERVQATLRRSMAERGWMTSGGSVRLAAASSDYLRHCAALREVPELASLAATEDEAKTQVGRLLRPLRSGTHPLRLLVAIHWLFGTPAEFLAFHSLSKGPVNEEVTSTAPAPRSVSSEPEGALRAQLFDLLESGTSVTAAAGELGIDVATAMAWAAQAAIPVGRRPKVVKGKLRQSLVKKLRQGADKADVAASHGVSVPTVTRILRTEIGLHSAWTTARFEAAKRRARGAWLELLAQHRSMGTKLLRAMDPATYAWLYRNDRTWLDGNRPDRTARNTTSRTSRVRWDERDQALSLAVQRAAVELSDRIEGRPLKLWQVYQAVPELKAKLSVLDRLPLTQEALRHVLGPQRRRGGNQGRLL